MLLSNDCEVKRTEKWMGKWQILEVSYFTPQKCYLCHETPTKLRHSGESANKFRYLTSDETAVAFRSLSWPSLARFVNKCTAIVEFVSSSSPSLIFYFVVLLTLTGNRVTFTISFYTSLSSPPPFIPLYMTFAPQLGFEIFSSTCWKLLQCSLRTGWIC